jgi:hypothetical protein
MLTSSCHPFVAIEDYSLGSSPLCTSCALSLHLAWFFPALVIYFSCQFCLLVTKTWFVCTNHFLLCCSGIRVTVAPLSYFEVSLKARMNPSWMDNVLQSLHLVAYFNLSLIYIVGLVDARITHYNHQPWPFNYSLNPAVSLTTYHITIIHVYLFSSVALHSSDTLTVPLSLAMLALCLSVYPSWDSQHSHEHHIPTKEEVIWGKRIVQQHTSTLYSVILIWQDKHGSIRGGYIHAHWYTAKVTHETSQWSGKNKWCSSGTGVASPRK